MTDLIDEKAVNAATYWVCERQALGEQFIKHFGVQQIVEAYEKARRKTVPTLLQRDPERIKRFREENGCSLLEARNAIVRHQVEDALHEATSIDDLKQILAVWLEVLK